MSMVTKMGFWSSKTKKEKSVAPEIKEAPRSPVETPASKSTGANGANAIAGIKRIIAVASGKGGVGKSTVAINLAKSLEMKGFRVGILDADVHGPSLPLMLTASNPTEMRDQLLVAPISENMKVISSAMFSSQKAHIMRGPMAANFIRQLLMQVDWGNLDFLIIDYPPGTGDIQLTLSQSCNITAAVIVSSPQEVALADVRKACQMFETLKVPILGLIETMSWFECDQCDKKHFIFKKDGGRQLAQQLGVPLLAQIPLDPSITEHGDSGKSFVSQITKSPAALAFAKATDASLVELKNLQEQTQNGLVSFSLKWQ